MSAPYPRSDLRFPRFAGLPVSPADVIAILGVAGFAASLAVSNGAGKTASLTTAAITAILAIFLRGLYNLWSNAAFKYAHFDALEQGSVMRYIGAARKSIVVTHFSDAVPSNEYVSLMLGKIDAGVQVRRIVPQDFDPDSPRNAWLERFEGLAKYTQARIASMDIPIEFYVIDSSKVIMLYERGVGSDWANAGIQIDNADVARWVQTAFSRITIQ